MKNPLTAGAEKIDILQRIILINITKKIELYQCKERDITRHLDYT